MIPRFKPQYNWREWKAACAFFSRDNIPKYEQEFAHMFGCQHGIMFSHGRSGIYALLKVWGLKNTEVICPAYTCVVVPNAIVLSGNRPVFVDCEQGSYNMSMDGIRQAISKNTRAIVATHLFGYPMNVLLLQEIVEEYQKKYGHKIYVIQDCAHSYGAKWRGQLVSKYGDAAIFGSNISKIINSIFGGMVITNDKPLEIKLKHWRKTNLIDKGWRKSIRRLCYFIAVNFAFNHKVYGYVNWLERKGWLDRFVKYYDDEEIDFPADWNEMPSEIEARVGLVQLEKYHDLVKKRTQVAQSIIKQFKDDSEIMVLPYDEGATYSHIVGLVNSREEWIQRYYKKGEQLGILIEYVIPSMTAYFKKDNNNFPVAIYYSNHTINFPVYNVHQFNK